MSSSKIDHKLEVIAFMMTSNSPKKVTPDMIISLPSEVYVAQVDNITILCKKYTSSKAYKVEWVHWEK